MILSTVLGGVTGLVGSIATSITKYKLKKLELEEKKMEREHERQMAKLKIESMIRVSEANIKTTQAIMEGKEASIDAQSYLESQKQQSKDLFSERFMDLLFSIEGFLKYPARIIAVIIAFFFAVIDIIRSLMRPSITVYQAGITTWFAYRAWDIMQKTGQSITPDQAVQIFLKVMDLCIYLTVSCITWWFADRRLEKYLMGQLQPKVQPKL